MSELHNIFPENVVFCYRDEDAGSLEVANYYKSARNIPASHLIPLLCSSDNIISQSDYLSTIEQPLIDALNILNISTTSGATVSSATSVESSSGIGEIWVIILGYNIPHAYLSSSGETIAIASRLHRIGHAIQEKYPNFTYDRRGNWRYFDPDDATELYITAVIDGPTVSIAKALIDRSLDIDNQTFVSGELYVDPYGQKTTEDQIEYQDDILNFIGQSANNLGLIVNTTVDVEDPYQEPQVPFFRRDSFYWGWFTPRYSRFLFLNQNQRRVFLYNADDDSAANIKEGFSEEGSDPWCNIAIGIDPGYAACAGSIESPGEDAYLRPRPFFEALQRGSTIGEAFLFSSPFVNWKIFLIGDPLLVVNFPNEVPPELDLADTSLPNDEVIRLVKEDLEESLAYALRQTRITQDMLSYNYQSNDILEETIMLDSITQWRDAKSTETRMEIFYLPVKSWLYYLTTTTGLSVENWLDNQGEKISMFLSEAIDRIASGSVSSTYVHPKGHWTYEFVYIHNRNTRESIHFRIQVATDAGFTNIVVGSAVGEANSYYDTEGWKYESEIYNFLTLLEFGLPSNFSGRKIRFDSPEDLYLTRTEIYYVRWRPLDSSGNDLTDAWETDTSRFIIKR